MNYSITRQDFKEKVSCPRGNLKPFNSRKSRKLCHIFPTYFTFMEATRIQIRLSMRQFFIWNAASWAAKENLSPSSPQPRTNRRWRIHNSAGAHVICRAVSSQGCLHICIYRGGDDWNMDYAGIVESLADKPGKSITCRCASPLPLFSAR